MIEPHLTAPDWRAMWYPHYPAYEQIGGRLRAPLPEGLFHATWSQTGHDAGDEDTER